MVIVLLAREISRSRTRLTRPLEFPTHQSTAIRRYGNDSDNPHSMVQWGLSLCSLGLKVIFLDEKSPCFWEREGAVCVAEPVGIC